MKKLLILFLLFAGAASAQKIPDYGFNKIRIVANEKIVQADLLPVKSDPVPEMDKLYYWSSSNEIHSTQGGYSGKLLNGSYTEYFQNKGLKEQGQFSDGLKTGVWKTWTENGMIVQFYTWENGVMSGDFELFDDRGQIKQKGQYRNNQLNGRLIRYNTDGKTQVTTYKNGKVVENPSSFWSKVNILKKLRKDSVKNEVPKQSESKPKQ